MNSLTEQSQIQNDQDNQNARSLSKPKLPRKTSSSTAKKPLRNRNIHRNMPNEPHEGHDATVTPNKLEKRFLMRRRTRTKSSSKDYIPPYQRVLYCGNLEEKKLCAKIYGYIQPQSICKENIENINKGNVDPTKIARRSRTPGREQPEVVKDKYRLVSPTSLNYKNRKPITHEKSKLREDRESSPRDNVNSIDKEKA